MAIYMASSTDIGTVVGIYDLRTVGAKNRSVLNFRIAINSSKRVNDEWVEGPTLYKDVVAWGKLAENIKDTWRVGDRVFVHGRVEQQEDYEKDGETRTGRQQTIADFAGHDSSFFKTTQDRQKKDGGSNTRSEPRREAKAATAAAKPEPKAASDDIFDEIDFDFGTDSSKDDDLAF